MQTALNTTSLGLKYSFRQSGVGAMNLAISRWLALLGLVSACLQLGAEPLADFDGIVARCQQAFNERPATEVAYAEAAGSWVKRQYASAALNYRVQATHSKVSPFVGQLDIVETAAARRADDESSARALLVSLEENVIRTVREIHFAYQGDRWKLLGATMTTEVKRDASDAFTVADKTRLRA